jgi:hypothetical protein
MRSRLVVYGIDGHLVYVLKASHATATARAILMASVERVVGAWREGPDRRRERGPSRWEGFKKGGEESAKRGGWLEVVKE